MNGLQNKECNPLAFLHKSPQESKFQKHSGNMVRLLEDYKEKGNSPFHPYQIQSVLNARAMTLNDESARLKKNIDPLTRPPPEPVLIVAPTGSGKSGMITLLPYALASKKVLILTPSHIISDQIATAFWYEKGTKCFFENCGLVQNDENRQENLERLLEEVTVIRNAEDIGRNLGRLVIVNAQKFGGRSKMSLSSNCLVYRNEKIIQDVEDFFKQFDTLNVDEAHYYPAKTWSKIIEEFSKPAPGLEKKIIFLTATPYKNKNGVPEFILGPEASKQLRIAYEVKKSHIEGITIRECDPLVEHSHSPHGANKNEEFENVYGDLKVLLNKNFERESRFVPQAMILVRLKKEAETLVKVLNRKSGRDDFAVAFVGDKKGVAAEALERFTKGEFQVGVTCGIAKDGYDNPKVTVCVILRKIVNGTILFNQFVGRCMRMHRGLPTIIPDESVGVVMSYKEFEQRKLWDEREKYVAEEDPIEVDFDEEKEKRSGRKRRRVR